MKKIKFTIARKIIASLAVILFLFIITAIFSIAVLQQNIDDDIANIYQPSLDQVEELAIRLKESEKYSNTWIYQPNESDKAGLRLIHSKFIPEGIAQLNTYVQRWSNQDEAETLRNTLVVISRLAESEKAVMQALATTADYDSAENIERAITVFEKEVMVSSKEADIILQNLIVSLKKQIAELAENKVAALNRLRNTIIILGFIGFAIGVFASAYLTRSITRPIIALKSNLNQLSQGEIPTLTIQKTGDEIGEMVDGMESYLRALKNTSVFAGQIGMGEFNTEYKALSERDILGNALISMRDNLKKSAEEERKRTWAVEGLAQFGEILRNQDPDIEKFGDQVLSFTVKYVNANQGKLYVVNDDVKDDEYLQMISCYAWDKKKFVQQKINKGEGLTGQCWQEGEAIYMTKVPDAYVKITSGLGAANPTNIFIVPLKVNEAIFGVIELASFSVFEDSERDFMLKLSENLAAAISTVRINNKTKTLLTQTQQQAEEMRSQEEEMRQNMEELSATQEEMGRKEKEYVRKIEELEKKLIVLSN